MMKVTLIQHTPEPEKLVAVAARMCYSSSSGSEIVEKITPEIIGKMIMQAKESHHDSLFEHITFTFLIEGVSRVLSHQLVRHRIGVVFHQRSQRYVKQELKDDVYVPMSILSNNEAYDVFNHAITICASAYNKLIDLGVPKEDARYVFPNATNTQLIMTVNARELIHILNLRLCQRAQDEIQRLFTMILWECRKACPLIFNSVGPNCYQHNGVCPEGKMSCGKCEVVCKLFLPEKFNERMKRYELSLRRDS